MKANKTVEVIYSDCADTQLLMMPAQSRYWQKHSFLLGIVHHQFAHVE